MGSENSDYPECYTRQFVSDAEAEFFKEVEKKAESTTRVSTIMVCKEFRMLTTVSSE